MIEVNRLSLEGVYEITPRRFADARGFFSETYNAAKLEDIGVELTFVQDNHSFSVSSGVLRGLHYQLPPFAQVKLVRVVRGAILDVAVDIRKSSSTFGKWLSVEISAEKWNQLLVPVGFAHGFVTLVESTEVIYKVTAPYSPEHERAIRFDDPALAIDWQRPAGDFIISTKDSTAPLLSSAEAFQ